ncbi:MAG: insulinase family protein [Anaerolineales bacterium]|nr:insulinase family protein [Anaerolineales bacterium]
MTDAGRAVFKTRLSNGLEIRLQEVHTAPVISNWIWYRVGSRNEKPGTTGVSHWVEHMQFKGTPTFPAGKLDRVISRDGGYWNAFTWLDWTAYFETMPADRIQLAFDLESDRMQNSQFDPDEIASERTVIISERQGHENDPDFRLSEEVQAAAFRVHSYHHEVIGDMADLETMNRDDLYGHYRRHYVPANAVIAIAGDFVIADLMVRIEDAFGGIPAGDPPTLLIREEPLQQGERRVTVEGPEEIELLSLAYHAPHARSGDFLPLAVLDSVLAGASSLNFFSGGLSNKTSRLYQALVDGEQAASVQGSLAATIDPYLYEINATIRPDRTPEEVLLVLDGEIDRVWQEPISDDELQRAIKQASALFAYSSETITNQAFWMGYTEMFADFAWFESYMDQLRAVTSEDVLQAARTYLLPSNRVVGMYRKSRGSVHA